MLKHRCRRNRREYGQEASHCDVSTRGMDNDSNEGNEIGNVVEPEGTTRVL